MLFIVSCFVYGLDLKTPNGVRRALTSQIKNEGKTNHFYQIDEHFAFFAFTDRGPDVGVTTYTTNFVPFCFTCGWYTGDPDDNRGLNPPVYKDGHLLYAGRTEFVWAGIPEDVFPFYNTKTKEFGYVMDSLELGEAPFAVSKKLSHGLVSMNYDEMSYESADDEDCMIAFGATFLGYILLAIWWIIGTFWWLIRKLRHRPA